ncbi:MAG: cytochrome c biogenesis CcdA family protein [Nitrosopumilaceae archaeon]
MIFLPCTLPLAFIIVPIAMNKSAKKGLLMAVLFGIGMMITFSLYGIMFSQVGRITGLLTANVIAGIIGGGLAFLFGLAELGLIKMKIPGYEGPLPSFTNKLGDYPKAFAMGLILANVGVGCPNPVFYTLLAYVIGSGSILTGWSLLAIHGIGRATPLIFLALLGIVGINATPRIIARAGSVRKWTAWGLIITGAILFVITGAFRGWFEETPLHDGWNDLISMLTGGKLQEVESLSSETSIILETIPQWLGPYVLVAMIFIPIVWYFIKKSKQEVR